MTDSVDRGGSSCPESHASTPDSATDRNADESQRARSANAAQPRAGRRAHADSATGRCPACGADEMREVERVSADRIAEAWAWQDAFAGETVESVAAKVRADLGTESVTFDRCGRCGLEVASPARAWSAANYPPESYGIAWDHLRALDLLARHPSVRLLEVGCADGKFLEQANALGHRSTGLDFSARSVASAVRRGVDARVASVRDVARIGGDERFGAIALFQVIEHLEAPDETFDALSAVAAPGSLLILGLPADLRYSRRIRHLERIGRSDFWDYPPQHVLRWTPVALEAFLRSHGWRVEIVEYEPLSIAGAAAHLAAVAGKRGGWIDRPFRRRAAILAFRARLMAARMRAPMTGTRLFVVARREG